MLDEEQLLEKIKRLVAARQYLVKNHAHLHSLEEGFTESDMAEALAGKCRVLEHLSDVFSLSDFGLLYDEPERSRSAAHCLRLFAG